MMAKIKHHGLRKPDDPTYQEGYTISTVHGFRRIKDVNTTAPDDREAHGTNVAGHQADVGAGKGTRTPGTEESVSTESSQNAPISVLEILAPDEWDKLEEMVSIFDERRKKNSPQ